MHPLLATRARLLLYLLVWTPVMTVVFYPAWPSWMALAPAALFYAFVCLSPWYLCRARPLRPSDLAELVALWLGAALAAGGLLAGAVRLAGLAAANFEPVSAPHYDLLLAMGTLAYLLAAGMHYTALAMIQSQQAARHSAEARELAREAELYALRLQLNPHFLFNSLHSIAALALLDAARAHRMTVRLGEFLRATLDLGGRDRIPLSQELALARNYLEIERIRFGDRLRVVEEVDESCAECAVPALLLQPLVENAVKHGAAARTEGGEIKLIVRRSGAAIEIAVENEFEADDAPPARAGIGEQHVRRRLEACYGAAATFECGAVGPVYRAGLRLPCEPSIASSKRV